MGISPRTLGPGPAFESLVRSATFAVLALDPDGRVILWNRGAERIFGWSEAEAVGRVLPAIPPEDMAMFEAMRDRVLAGEVVDGAVLPALRADGEVVDVVLSIRVVEGGLEGRPAILAVAAETGESGNPDALRRQVDRLELQLAETQLPPHFLFNALHAVGVLLRRENREDALRVVVRLGDVLRHGLRSADDEPVTLRAEVDVLRKYLEVERARHRDRFRVEVEVDPEAADARVPALVLQPLVENALRHGLSGRQEAGVVAVRARRRGDRVRILVEDDGRGLPSGWSGAEDEGVGLRATRARLRLVFGEDVGLRLQERDPRGTVARVDIPYRPVPGAAAGG